MIVGMRSDVTSSRNSWAKSMNLLFWPRSTLFRLFFSSQPWIEGEVIVHPQLVESQRHRSTEQTLRGSRVKVGTGSNRVSRVDGRGNPVRHKFVLRVMSIVDDQILIHDHTF